jgi:hypothetical protein
MIAAAIVLLPLLFFSVWLFYRIRPSTKRVGALRRYNMSAVVAAATAATCVAICFWSTTGQSGMVLGGRSSQF